MLREDSSAQAVLIKTGSPGSGSGGGLVCYAKATPTAADQRLGYNLFGSVLGADIGYNAVGIGAYSAAAWAAASSHPSYIRFDTCASGTATRSERMRITEDGNVGVDIIAPTARLDVGGAVKVKSYTVAGVPSAATNGAGAMIYVSNETGGAVIAFSDGTNWRRVTDRAVIS